MPSLKQVKDLGGHAHACYYAEFGAGKISRCKFQAEGHARWFSTSSSHDMREVALNGSNNTFVPAHYRCHRNAQKRAGMR